MIASLDTSPPISPSAHCLNTDAISAAHAGSTDGMYSSVGGATMYTPFPVFDKRTTFPRPPWPMYHGAIACVAEIRHECDASFAYTDKVILIIVAI